MVLFPYHANVFSCGITGVLAFKGRSAEKDHFSLQDLEEKVETLFEHARQHFEKKEYYPGGKEVLGEIKRLCGKLKSQDVFCEVFSNQNYQERLWVLCTKLEGVIETEDSLLTEKKGRLAAEEHEVIARRATELRDVVWSLRNEVVVCWSSID